MRRNKFKSVRKFECLEERRLMVGDISFDDGVLTIDGDGLNDVAVVRFEGDEVQVDLTVAESGGGTDTHDEDVDIEDVQKIVFNGFAGNDRLNLTVGTLSAGVNLDGIELEFNGGDNDDVLDNLTPTLGVKTRAFGGAGNDTLEGGRFNDTFDGGAGNDILIGLAGNDTYFFSGLNPGRDEVREAANVDTDTLDFSNFQSFISANLATAFSSSNPNAFAVTAFQSNLQVKLNSSTGIEDVVGTPSTDTIVGNSRGNHLFGLGMNDRLTGAGGNDILEGGEGNDTYEFAGTNLGTDDIIEAANTGEDHLKFSGMTVGLNIDISKAGSDFAVDNANLRLRLSNNTAIENVTGTNFNDNITGNSRNNTLKGLDGIDGLTGLGGADTLEGGSGIDVFTTDALDQVFGGLGRDFFDGVRESSTSPNPRPTRYLDWGLL